MSFSLVAFCVVFPVVCLKLVLGLDPKIKEIKKCKETDNVIFVVEFLFYNIHQKMSSTDYLPYY